MKELYFDLMERALSAYTDEHIARYFQDVKRDGLSEHGFPRLTANMGILLAHGRRADLRPIFLEMMEYCCRTIPTVKAANDFSVREIVCCLREIEHSGAVDAETVARWKRYLSAIDPAVCYNAFAVLPTDKVKNWALFTGVSEFFRKQAGLGGSDEFIDTQLASQLQWLDENGMYMDGKGETHHPIMYDIVPRGLFALLLTEGYRGRYYADIDACLRRAGRYSLMMQSPNGEMAFGGRSNQFVLNEPWLAVIYEYEARRYAQEGNSALAGAYKAAIRRALAVTEHWLSEKPIRHIKNRFPTETRYGCENYAYFDKYMITVASNLYAAYRICDDAIPAAAEADRQPSVWATSRHFSKLFLKAGGYGLEFELDADPHYDAAGLGRVHRDGAPSTICLSVPCPAKPVYKIDLDAPVAVALCPVQTRGGEWDLSADAKTNYEVIEAFSDDCAAYAALRVCFADGACVQTRYAVSAGGVRIEATGENDVSYMLPALYFDGEQYAGIELADNELRVFYGGWLCRYVADGVIRDTGKLGANRNGHYRAYMAQAKRKLHIRIEIGRL